MDIGLDLQRAYDDGYKKGWEEAEAYALHCGDETPITNADRIRAMSDEELADYFSELSCWPNAGRKDCRGMANCMDCWLDWLRQEANDVGQ